MADHRQQFEALEITAKPADGSGGRTWGERQVMVSLAGSLAARRALQGSEPGYQRLLSLEQSTCFHEAGHAVVARALGWHAYELNLDPDPALKDETRAAVLAYCLAGAKPHPPAGMALAELESDKRRAATLCLVAAGDWKGALRHLRVLRATTSDLVEEHWQGIRRLAWELARYRRLDQAQINHILEK